MDNNIGVIETKLESLKENFNDFKLSYHEDMCEIKEKLDRHNNFKGKLEVLYEKTSYLSRINWLLLTSILILAFGVIKSNI